MSQEILRLPAVKQKTGLSRSTIYQQVKQGLFPSPVKIGARAVGWPSDEVYAVNAARIAGKPDSAIRALVDSFYSSQPQPQA